MVSLFNIESIKTLNLSGLGKSTYPLSANANVLSAPLSAFRSNVNVNLLLQCYVFRSNVMLACYQQAGRVGSGGRNGKYVGISWKWVRWFTLTLNKGSQWSLVTTNIYIGWNITTMFIIYNNHFRLIIDISFYETLSTLTSENKRLHS
jgi:hypothetical protein